MDVKGTGRVVHALAALRDTNGNLTDAAAKLGTSEGSIMRALEEAGPKFYSIDASGSVHPTPMGLGFADQKAVFPWVNW